MRLTESTADAVGQRVLLHCELLAEFLFDEQRSRQTVSLSDSAADRRRRTSSAGLEFDALEVRLAVEMADKTRLEILLADAVARNLRIRSYSGGRAGPMIISN